MQKAIGTQEQEVLQELLKTCRREAGLTQRELAARLKTIHTRIGGYERGERRMDLVQLDEYTAALGIPLVRFVQRYAQEVAKFRTSSRTNGTEGANGSEGSEGSDG
jgi:transcriptional regulator with XRE-family HTH domain